MHEYAREMHRAKVLVRKLKIMVKAALGRPRFGKKSGQAWRGPDMAQQVFWMCVAKKWDLN